MKSLRTWTCYLGLVASVSLAAIGAAESGSGDPALSDWPQWRGPNRDGVAVASPKLLDAWPKDGPKLLWTSDTIPTRSVKESKDDDVGGSGSPIVWDGKVFLFVHWKHQVEKILITTQMLKDFGWEEGVPDDLARKIEAARLSDKRKDLAGAALDAYIKEFIAGVDPELAKKFGAHITLRLTQGREALSWEQDFAHLVKARDKECSSFKELFDSVDHVFNPGTHGAPGSDKIMPLFLEFFLKKVFHYTDTVLCLDAATGKELWKKDFPGELPERECKWPSSTTPSIVKDRIYVAGSAGLYCLSARDGALVWQTPAMLGNSSPLVEDGRIYIYEGDPDKVRFANRAAFFGVGMLSAYSAEDGKLLWHQPRVKYTNGSVVSWSHEGKKYLISGAAGGPYCVDPATGDVLWEQPQGAPHVPGSWTNHGTPAVSGDIVVLFADPQMAFKLTPQKAELLWKMPGGTRGASPLIYQDHAYFFGGGSATCVELKSGVVKWCQRSMAGECSSPVLADGKIFYAPVCNQWYLPRGIGMFTTSPEKFEQMGLFPAWMSEIASPAIADGKLYVRMFDSLACYDLTQYGPYVDKTVVTKDKVTFVFKQTGGGLVAKDTANSLKDIVITDASGAAKPAQATMSGDTVVVDIKDAPVPFGISCGAANSLEGKDGKPVPAFGWNGVRELTYRKCFDQTLVLKSNRTLDLKPWNDTAAYVVAGATVKSAVIDPSGMSVTLTTDKTWKAGDTLTLSYPCFRVEQGEPRREKLAFTVPEIQRAAAKFIKTDEGTVGTWKGVYGAEGAVIAGDVGAAPKCAVVTVKKNENYTWATSNADPRALQKSADANDRIISCWFSGASFDIDIEVIDGKEHQVALYGLDWDGNDGRAMTVDVQDALTNAVLDTQTVKQYTKGKYAIWNVKGNVTLHITSTGAMNAVVNGLFIDPAPSAK